MYYKEDWEKSKERYKALWQGQIVDRCCVSITSPRRGYEHMHWGAHGTFLRNRNDPKAVLEDCIASLESTYFGGDAIPQVWMNYGPAGLAAYFADFKDDGKTTWYDPVIRSWDADMPVFDPACAFFCQQIEMAEFLAKEGKDRFILSKPDNSGIMDALAALRGSLDLLVDTLTAPDKVHEALRVLTDAWIYSNNKLYEVTTEGGKSGSSIGWMSIWAPGNLSQLQADISVMISNSQFREFVMPELKNCAASQDYSLYHLDGTEQIRHLDDLLSVNGIGMIQWTSVAGQPNYMHQFDTLRRIQAAGIGLMLTGVIPKDIETVMENLSHKGLMIMTSAATQDEAEMIVKSVAKLTRDK